jgi:cobalt-zinc-cadmium efflux system membrane fusion protein
MALKRINRLEKIPFKKEGDFLESTMEATEPHSFKIKIAATYKDKTYDWEYESYEGRVELTPEAIKANKIIIEEAGPINLEIKLDVMGKIRPNEELTVYMSPRFPGMVKAVNKKLGDYVRKGEILAVIESNESLQNYEVRSEINGMIIKKNINLGMYLSGQENIFVISDLSSVWADFNIYRQDLSRVYVGDPIQVTSLDGGLKEEATISYISPLGNENTQSVVARAVLTNPREAWKPGLFISGQITIEDVPIHVAVKEGALQTFRDWDVVFLSVGNLFEVVPVQLGRKNKEWVEIKSGLNPGDRYVSENSFILKADLEKSGAKHEH